MVKHLHTLCSGFPPGATDSYRVHDLRTLLPRGWTRPSVVRFPAGIPPLGGTRAGAWVAGPDRTVLLHTVTYPFPVDGAPPGRDAPITSSGDMPDNRPSVLRRLAADSGGPQ